MRSLIRKTRKTTGSFIRKSKSRLNFRYQEGISYVVDSIKPVPSDQVRLLIFGQGRTGSTLLESLLCSTGYFPINGELLNNSKGDCLFPIQYIRGLAKRRAHENFICHVKIYQLTHRKRPVDPAAFLEALRRDGWKFIYLRRRNKIRQALSNVVVDHRGSFKKLDDGKENLNVLVDCENFVERVNKRFQFDNADKEALANIEYHEVVYEDDLESPAAHQETIDGILEYVSLEPRMATTKLRKVTTQSLNDLVSNYDEFSDCLRKQGWQEFLEC